MWNTVLGPVRARLQRKWVGNDLRYFLRPSFKMVMGELLEHIPAPSFIEIGANDGIASDKLHPYILEHEMQGILVEPLPAAFDRLKANYSGRPDLIFENCAISNHQGVAPFYCLKQDYAVHAKVPLSHTEFTDRISSLSLETLLKHITYAGDWRDIVETVDVPIITFEQLCERHAISSVDVLQIDAEGHDAAILCSIDLALYAPALVCFEHLHLSGQEYVSALEHLTSHGYLWTQNDNDIIGLRHDLSPR